MSSDREPESKAGEGDADSVDAVSVESDAVGTGAGGAGTVTGDAPVPPDGAALTPRETHGTLAGVPLTRCPWCHAWWAKGPNCNWVACGLQDTGSGERAYPGVGGCGRQFCFQCAGKLCGDPIFDAASGAIRGVSRSHSASCGCVNDETYCPGGHNSHCEPRWSP